MSEKVDLKEVLEGLDTVLRKSGDGEIYVYLNSAFEPQLSYGKSDVDVRVLTPEASKTLLERLNAEIRVPCGQEVIWGNNGWYTTVISHSKPRICKKKPEPEYRKLEPGEPVMPGDVHLDSLGMKICKSSQNYQKMYPKCQGENTCTYARKPWTKEEYLKRQAEWVEFHNLKPGDTVKVCCKASYQRDGWHTAWMKEMTAAVGKEYKVTGISYESLITGIRLDLLDGEKMCFPFYVLQVVKNPEPVKPKYREFKTVKEVFDWMQAHGSEIISGSRWTRLTNVVDSDVVDSDMRIFINGNNYSAFKDCKSVKDGTPFGVPE